MMKEYSIVEIAQQVSGTVVGNQELLIHGVNSLRLAEEGELSFLSNARHVNQLQSCGASAIIVPNDWKQSQELTKTFIVCEDPDKAFAKVCALFAPPPIEYAPGIHPSAVIAEDVKLGENVYVGPNAVIMDGAEIGDNTKICACSYVGQFVKIGKNCTLYPGVRILHRCVLGNKIILHAGVVIGADGFGYTPSFRGLIKVPQNGIVRIDDDVEVGANSTIDRARFGITWIKKGVKIDNLVQIGHNSIIGESSVLIAQSGVAGSAELGRGVVLQAKAGVNGHITMGDGSKVLGCSAAQRSTAAGDTVYGVPGENQKAYLERFMLPTRMRKLMNRVDILEQKLKELEEGKDSESSAE